jgi:peptide deformylase
MTTSALDRAAAAFADELAQWRAERGLSKKQLAADMGFDPSYVSHVEGCRHRPTEDFARRAEAVLQTGGAIWTRFTEYDELRRTRGGTAPGGGTSPGQWLPPGAGLVVEHEIATLSYVDGIYHCTIRRHLYNAGTEPVTRYPVRVAVDRFPGEPERSNRFYRDNPLTWDELNLAAYHGDGPDGPGEPMEWRASHDRDSFKEVWVLFENDQSRFPLYRGQRTVIQYSYQVGEDKWGRWFQRAVRLPTRRLTVRLSFPTEIAPAVWGVQTSLTAESPLNTPVQETIEEGISVFEWTTDNPPLTSRYRLQWRFRSAIPQQRAPMEQASSRLRDSERMRAIGIVQRGSDQLRQPARPFDLPSQEPMAREVVNRLLTALDRIGELRVFNKGVGLAAPQLGLGWAVAVVRPPEVDALPVILLNPRVVGQSSDVDEQYEGCLSFFDVRGLVRRPLRLEVEHATFAGTTAITVFEQGLARLVAHEIDHLEGRLYVDRMAPAGALVPVEEYRGSGTPWRYG